MPAHANMRKLSMGPVIAIAMVAVLLPLCMAVDCGMGAGGMHHSSMLGFASDCSSPMALAAPAAIAPGSPQSLILLLVAAFGGALALTSPPLAVRFVRAAAVDPPPPPEDPRGVRLII